MAYKHLFSPVKIGSVEIPNRIAMMPMGMCSPPHDAPGRLLHKGWSGLLH